MKIVIAPDSFKESLTALEVATAIERGFKQVFPNAHYLKVPVADGGEGTVRSLVDATQGSMVELRVAGPAGENVDAFFGILGDGKTAVIEMAAASGLHLVPSEMRNPMTACSRGTGELILAALDEGVNKIILGLGGSATNDGGVGMMKALGVVFRGKSGSVIESGGQGLGKIADIDLAQLDSRLPRVQFEVACDVDNPLCGEKGASAIFAAQKGATPEMIMRLDNNLSHYAGQLKKQLGKDVAQLAGGMGASVLAFFAATLRPGVDIVTEMVGLAKKVVDADLVITGEGRIDSQSIHGKAPIGVARIAQAAGCPVIGLAGSLSSDCDVCLITV